MTLTRSAARSAATGTCAAGLLTAVAGTFLPWLRSGAAERNSYQAVGIAEQLVLRDDALAGALLRAWLTVPLLAVACVGLLVLGWRRTGAALAAVLALLVGTVGVVVLVQGPGASEVVGVTPTGPAVTSAGMTIALLGALTVLGTARRDDQDTGRAGV
ncbi:hypothetical protein [Prauserella muralis]|uniref:Uncharacterized protein n=1 Tax=Prauserella muralis TaxID=588067 RepID=A0A2V4AP90_9PSEU|nr:hypothetical protein [Prauserella muralis]PXY22397.1 hypothetical protein BAY60_21275 [Prauserella muralis]TWE28059.1 hypothetical protein FHX69_0709 [Prauserella muralis]